MSISTRHELIQQLLQGNPDEFLVWTYWGEEDFENYKDKDQAYELLDEGLQTTIGEVNEYLANNYEEREENE